MEQKTPIIGYRTLSDEDIILVNLIKSKAEDLLALYDVLSKVISDRGNTLWANEQNAGVLARAKEGKIGEEEEYKAALEAHQRAEAEMASYQRAEPFRWAAMGRSDIQKGVMCLVRAVTQPDSLC